MKVEVGKLSGAALDWAVAVCAGVDVVIDPATRVHDTPRITYAPSQFTDGWVYSPSTDWGLGGVVIEKALLRIQPQWCNAGYDTATGYWYWRAYILNPTNLELSHESMGSTPLIAAMRCYVKSKLGDIVDIPEELL